MHHDLTSYKFSQPLEDLTHLQIQFIYICARKHQEQIDEAMGKTNSNGSNTNRENKLPTITDNDSPEVQRAKLDAIKAQFRRG